MALSRAFKLLSSTNSFYLPEIPCSLPLRVHPDYEWLSQQANEWAFGYMKFKSEEDKRFKVQWRMPLYHCMLVHVGGKAENLLCSKFIWLSAFMDDPLDGDATSELVDSLQMQQRLNNLLSIGFDPSHLSKMPNQESSEPLFKSYAEIMSEFRSLMLPPVYNRLLGVIKNWADSFGQQPVHTLDSYFTHRRSDVLVSVMLPFMEMCLGISVPDEELESDDYIAAKNAMVDHVWMVNDILSLPKELLAGKYKSSIYILLLTDPTIRTVQEAVNKVCGMIQDKEKEFTYYNDILARNASAANKHEFTRYLDLTRNMIPGNRYWHYISARYYGLDNPFVTGQPFHGMCLFHPDCTMILPDHSMPVHPYLLNV